MDMYSISDSYGLPCEWKVTHFAHIGGNEEFVAQLVAEMPELVEATRIYGPEREKLKEAIIAISIEGLMPAFEHLKNIRLSTKQLMPELNRKQLYEEFSRVLWHAYKDLMQKAAKLMDPSIGFLFQKDTQFEAGLAAFEKKWLKLAQTNVGDYLRSREPCGKMTWPISETIIWSTRTRRTRRFTRRGTRPSTRRGCSTTSGAR